MADRKIIAVMGATGAQGGGLARAILSDLNRGFSVRAITRNAASEKALALAELGAEVVAADLDTPASINRAFAGAYGAYCVTSFREQFSVTKEQAQARAMAEAAKRARVQHVIWSTLEDSRRWIPLSDQRMPTLMGRYKVPHFDGKGEVDRVFADLGVPTTFLRASFYWDNLIDVAMAPKKAHDGKLAFTLPMDDKKLPGIAAEDIGRCAYGIFKRGRGLIGKPVGIAGEHLSGAQMAWALAKALGREVRYNAVSAETYRGFDFAGAEDAGNMFQFYRDFNDVLCGARNVELSRSLNPALKTFDAWLAANKSRIPLE
jgi:uncharacterized protein YbjT (DUF2867 family)